MDTCPRVTPFFPHVPLQSNFVKAVMPLTEWLLREGDQVVALVQRLEKNNKVTYNTFKGLEHMRDKTDFREVSRWLLEEARPTCGGLIRRIRDLNMERWWHWCFLHPDLVPTHMHPSRRMCPALLCLCQQVA